MADRSDVNYSLIERIKEISPITEYRRMEDPEDREAMFHLRYEGYRRENRIPENKDELSIDYMDDMPNTQNFGVFLGGRLASCLRLSILTRSYPQSLCLDRFPDVLLPRFDIHHRILDPTRLVTDSKMAAQFPELPYLTMKLPIMACLHYGIDECVACVRKEHRSFYRRIFRAEPFSELRYYTPLNHEVQVMISDVRAIHSELDHRYPFWRSNYFERRQIFGPPEDMPGVSADDCDRAA